MRNIYRRLSKYLFPLISLCMVAGLVLVQVFAYMPANQLFTQKTRNALDTVNVFTTQGWAFLLVHPGRNRWCRICMTLTAVPGIKLLEGQTRNEVRIWFE